MLKIMETGELSIVFSGYENEMNDFLNINPGLKSRIPFIIKFQDYTSQELYQIFYKMCKDDNYKLSRGIKEVLLQHFETARKQKDFGNGRYCKTLYDKVRFAMSDRAVLEKSTNLNLIKKCDVLNAIDSIEFIEQEKRKIGF